MFIKLVNTLPDEVRMDMLGILLASDDDFKPSLSSRRKVGRTQIEKLNSYIDEKKNYPHVLLFHEGKLVGFSNFIYRYPLVVSGETIESIFIDTTCIHPNFRDLGYGKKLYNFYEEEVQQLYRIDFIARETWSTNTRQIHLYEKLEYKCVHTVLNDRSEGVHTLTYLKKIG